MLTKDPFQNSLLLLSYLITNADGVLDDHELDALKKICKFENIPNESLIKFIKGVPSYNERQIYEIGIEEVSKCSDSDKVQIFAWLHRISEVDGNVHVKEVRFLLYSIKKVGIDFGDVIEKSKELPSLV